MSPELSELIFKFILPVLAAALSYGAVRQDLKNIHEKIKDMGTDSKREIDRVEHAALRAHSRIDEHVSDYHRVK